MQAVLYIGHGSRIRRSAVQATRFIEQTMKHIQAPIQEVCFLELSKPSIMDGVKKCVEQGATRIAVMPFLLLTAGHAKEDIPSELSHVKKKYPNIIFEYGQPLGVHEKMIEVLEEKIKEKVSNVSEATILLVGRGSSDPEQAKDFEIIATMLESRSFVKNVTTCYLAANTPTFDEGLEKLITKKNKTVFVIPYILFSGILIKTMQRKIHMLNQQGYDFVLCDYIGYHEKVREVLVQRVEELLEVSFNRVH